MSLQVVSAKLNARMEENVSQLNQKERWLKKHPKIPFCKKKFVN